MRPLIYLFVLLFALTIQAQYNPDAPWMNDLTTASKFQSSKSEKTTFNAIVEAFNAYWKGKDPNKKGSGHKPFRRWENYWKNFVKPDGTLPSPDALWNSWLAVQQAKISSANADLSNWNPVGPFSHTNTGSWSSGQGRINAIIVDPNNPNTYYTGAPAGGIWKSTDAGNSWVQLSDNLPQIGVSGIAIDYNDSNTIYIATGDDDGWDTYSVGVMKSTDGGTTWNTTGLNSSPGSPTNMNDIYMHPSNSNILWVATNKGIYKTIDGGVTWDNTNGTENLNMKDIKLKPGDPNTIYAVTSNSFYVSTDGGDTFTTSGFGSGLPVASSRLVIDVTPNNSGVIYVLSALDNDFQGIYKSTDSGLTFLQMAATTPSNADLFDGSKQAYFDMALAVSDNDENEIYVGVLNIWKSTDGGTNFTKVNEWYQPFSASYSHADIHLLRFYDGVLFAGTDGGFYKTTDGGTNFTDLSEGLQIGQFYRLSVSRETSGKMIGGLQDNGGYAYNGIWQVYFGADGMDAAIRPNDSNFMYGFIQYGGNLYISQSTGASNDAYVPAPAAETDEDTNDNGGNWVTPLTMDKNGVLYAGYSSLYKLCGTEWEVVSPSFGNNVNIDVLEIDDIDSNNIYVAIDNTLRKSVDKGVSFSTTFTFSSNITSIEVNTNNSALIYVTTSGYSGGVYRSIDGGSSFVDITGSLPSVTKNIIKHQPLHSQNPLFLGTSLGVFRYDDTTNDWDTFGTNLPNVSVTDLEINVNDGNISAATYGRGIWQSDIPLESIPNEISLEAIQGIEEQVVCGSLNNVKARVQNRGTDPINEVTLNYTLNGNTENTVWNGTLAPGATQLIDIPSIIVSGDGFQDLTVSASVSGDSFNYNNELISGFYANTPGTVNVVNSFENPSDEILNFNSESNCSGSSGFWDRGIATGTLLNTESTNNTVYATNLSGLYENNIKSYLVTPCYDLSLLGNPVFKFKMAHDLEENWDIMYIEYSTDSGMNWSVLGTADDLNWYNSNTTPGANCLNCPGAQWTGTNTTLQEYSYDLSSLNSETSIAFRFVFHSDQYEVNEGVIIDDLSIEGTLNVSEFDPLVFRIYPNPSSDIFNIQTKGMSSFSYSITDMTGKHIVQAPNVKVNNQSYTLDMGSYASGVYFITLSTETGKITKKLILK
ncbi:T9SS type A sorting domain-containing protein [Aestuariivivens sediminicola]|uniref:T9SS type A sorting domain-containing protein n=1 Tax=Aestuariivivens sediminicola TaxID=2913560 RepID=UPI001F5662EB|nr:T9SS type A sorting domain-containing protein [Aestuariivivens sediminicola]